MIASFIRGLSVRDVEATLAEALGDQAATPSLVKVPRSGSYRHAGQPPG